MKNFTLAVLFMAIVCPCVAVPPTITSFSPTAASTGMTITINGTGFTGVTSVLFGGTAATSFNVVSDIKITAVVGAGSSGIVDVINASGLGSKTGFTYAATAGIITDFQGYWHATGASPGVAYPDTSHNLVAFTFNGITYSTGVNNQLLVNKGITFTAGNYKALPIVSIGGITSGGSTYIALGKKVDGSAGVANAAAVSNFSVKQALVDGVNGLDLGTGVTNLPASAVLTFPIFNINEAALNDAEPDILLTQIAQPVSGNDQFSFIDANGDVVGTVLVQDMTKLPMFGTWALDLFNLSPTTPYNVATAYSAATPNTTREVRVTGLKLSDFGITAGTLNNYANVKALRITPSGNSDYAFIAYNANSINLPPNIAQNDVTTRNTICSGGTAELSVLGSASSGGALSYTWEESTNNGSSWHAVMDGVNYSGASTSLLSIINPTNGTKYRATVHETGNPGTATSPEFTISVAVLSNPTSVSVSGMGTTCLNSSIQLTSNVTGGSNLTYQWQILVGGIYTNIPGAILNTFVPVVSQTGFETYRVNVSSGSGCGSGVNSTPYDVTVNGIIGTRGDELCGPASVTLSANATSGTIDWYDVDNSGVSLFTGNNFTTPVLSSPKTYYVTASGCAAALRVPVTAAVFSPAIGGSLTGSGTVVTGTNSTTLILTGYSGTIVKWQSSTDGFNSIVADIANTSSQLTVSNLTVTTSYRAIVENGLCPQVFSESAKIAVSGTLPVRIGSIRGARIQNRIRVQWTGYASGNTKNYELQKSSDGQNYHTIYSVNTANSSNDVSYQAFDDSPLQGYNFYRVREVFVSGSSELSSSVRVLFDNNRNGITIYPNPVVDRFLTVQFNGMPQGMYQLRIINNAGQVIGDSRFLHPGGYFPQQLDIPAAAKPGVYQLEVIGSAGFRKSFPILRQ